MGSHLKKKKNKYEKIHDEEIYRYAFPSTSVSLSTYSPTQTKQKNENQKKREKENLTFETAMRLYGIFVCERERQRSGMRVDFGYK